MAAGCIGPHSASLRAGFRFVQDDKSILIKAFEEVVACSIGSIRLRSGQAFAALRMTMRMSLLLGENDEEISWRRGLGLRGLCGKGFAG